jgi:hypothetical protein
MAEPRVLFVGNSATYFNDLPEMLRRLVPGLKYGQVTKGGQCLSGHANDPSVRWMITGEGPAPGAHIGLPRFSHGKDFFSDGEGWDVLVLQDRADSIGDWTRNEADVSRLNESLRALDVLASWVQIAAKKMRRRPSIVLYHRCLFDYNMLSNIDVRTARALCARGAEGILKYAGRLEARLGTDVPVRLLPAHEAFTLVHEEGQDVFRQLYAGDGEHNSRIGSYLVALLLFRLVTGQSPLGALDFRPVDDRSRLHVDMRQSPAEWLPSDDVQRQMWPWAPLPDVDENLAHRLRLWAHRVSSHPVQRRTSAWYSSREDSHDISIRSAYQNLPGPIGSYVPLAKSLDGMATPSQYHTDSFKLPSANTKAGSFTAPRGGSLSVPRGRPEHSTMGCSPQAAPHAHGIISAASFSPLVGTGLQLSGTSLIAAASEGCQRQGLVMEMPQQIPSGGIRYCRGVRSWTW